MARRQIPTSSLTTPSRGRATSWPAPDWDWAEAGMSRCMTIRAASACIATTGALQPEARSLPRRAPGAPLPVKVAGHQRQGPHPLDSVLAGAVAAVGVGG